MGHPVIHRLGYVHRFIDRHGVTRLYLRRRGCKAIALPPETDPLFLPAYQAALVVTAPEKPSRVLPGSLEALVRSYFAAPAFRQLGATTQAAYRRLIGTVVSAHGEKPARLMHTAAIRSIVNGRAATPSAANHTLRSLRALMRHAIEIGWRTDDPTQGVRRLKERAQGVPTWTEEDIATFEAHWPPGSKPRLALALLLYTGQRRSDVVRTGRQHVRGRAIQVRQVKTGTTLLIPLHPDLTALIPPDRNRLTFLMTDEGASARPYTPNGFYMRFATWCEAAGLPPGLSPHGLRKAAARRMAEAGCTAHQIASVTGHKTLAEVQRYTTAADQVRLAEAAILRIGRPRKPVRNRLI